MSTKYILFDQVTKKYGKGKDEQPALSEVNLYIKEGEFCVVNGTSGSGKTTMLNIIGALEKPSSGRVLFEGKTLPDAPTENAMNTDA